MIIILKIIDVPTNGEPLELNYDLEWLTILHFTDHLMSSKHVTQFMPGPSSNERYLLLQSNGELKRTKKKPMESKQYLQSLAGVAPEIFTGMIFGPFKPSSLIFQYGSKGRFLVRYSWSHTQQSLRIFFRCLLF